VTGVDSAVENAAKAIGLFGSDGNLSSDWFTNPLIPLGKVLTDPGQRAAVLGLLDQLWPPVNPPGAPPTEKWHPLLGPQDRGNLYLTVANGSGPLKIGLAGDAHSTASPLTASLRGHLPLVSVTGGSVSFISGTADGPFEAEVRVELNWAISKGQAIDLAAIRASAVLQPAATPPASLRIVLEGLRLEGTGAPRDTELDPNHLDAPAFQLVTGLLHEKLREIAGGVAGEAAAMANHLMPLLGLDAGLPAFPFATITTDPASFRNWIGALVSSGKIAEWAGHLGAIFGGAVSAQGSGTETDPWRVRIFSIDPNSPVEGTFAQVTEAHSGTPRMNVGIRATYIPAGTSPPARIDASSVIASIPLSGGTSAAVLPSASISIVAPALAADSLVDAGDVKIGSIRAGALWNGASVVPQLELDDVKLTIAGATNQYARIDLTNTDSVAGFASSAVADAIRAALGATGAGSHLAALAGLIKPSGDPGWNHSVAAAALVSNPTQAIAAVHRAALLDAAHNWSFLFAELAALISLPVAVTGTGVKNDPWRTQIAPGPISVDLAAWNAQESGNAADPQQLRIGLRASAVSTPWRFSWLAEVLAFDLPQSGSGGVSLMAGQHASFVLDPVPEVPAAAGVSISAKSAAITMDWSPGSAMQMRAVVSSIVVASGPTTVTIPSLVFPPPGGFDIANPLPTLGVSLADLEAVFRMLFSRALFAWADMEGLAVSALLGLNGNLPGLQGDWPALGGNFFADPFGSLRGWLAHIAVDLSGDGSAFLPNALAWLTALFSGNLPATPLSLPPGTVNGAGTYDDPWLLAAAQDVELISWLEPAGPPSTWAGTLSALIGSAGSFSDLVDLANRLGRFVPDVHEAVAGNDPAALSDALDTLSAWLAASDGFVPAESQIPAGGTWTAGTAIHSAHTLQPSDPGAIAQINAQIAAWNPSAKAVLLVGPALSDHSIWKALLTPVAVKPSFNLRVPGVDPSVADLRGVTDPADFYTADLTENGLPGVTLQIGRVVARIRELRPGVPVTLVAHSTAGLAARAFAQANPALVRGLITLGTPHLGTPLFPLLDRATGTALRAVKGLAPALPAGPLSDAVDALIRAADQYIEAPGPGQIPTPAPFPVAAFTAPGTIDTGGVPALALGGPITGDLLEQLKQALAARATGAANAARPAPTHLAFGIRSRLDFGVGGRVRVDAYLRGDAFRVPLKAGAPEPPRPAQALTVQIVLSSNDGWLAGSPADDVRVRWAELMLSITPGGITPQARLHDAAFHSPALGLVDLAHPQAQALLGAVFHALGSPAPTPGTALAGLFDALGSLKITAPEAPNGIGLSADAFTAIVQDPIGFLEPRLKSALNVGLAGFSGPSGGPYSRNIGSTPFQVYIDGARIGLRASAPISLGPVGSATVDARLAIPSLKPALDFSLSLGSATIAYSQNTGKATFSAKPWVDGLTLPPNAPDLSAAMNRAIPRILLSSAVSGMIEATIGPGFTISAIDPFLESPGAGMKSGQALGSGSCLDASKITGLLQGIASAAGLAPGPGIALPGNLLLTATGTAPVALTLATTAPIGGVADLQLSAQIDCSLHVTPAGKVQVTLPLPGTWPSVSITFGVDASGVSLVIAPQGFPPIQLLPTFSGLGTLKGGAKTLLPAALDALVDALPPSPLLTASLAVAQAFDLYDAATKFGGHSVQWKALTDGNWSASVGAAMRTAVIPGIRDVLSAITGSVAISGNSVTIGAGGPFGVALGWDTAPTVSLKATGLKAADGAVTADITAGYVSGAIAASVALGFHFQSSIGVTIVPQIVLAYSGGRFNAKILPLGDALESTLSITLAPMPAVNALPDAPAELAKDWLLPIATDLVVGAARPQFPRKIWSTGPSVQELLAAAGLITGGGAVASPLPPIKTIVTGLLSGLAAQASLAIGKFTLKFVSDGTGLGINLRGSQDISAGDIALTLRFDNLDVPAPSQGITLYVFRNPADFQISPRLVVSGLGIEFSGAGGGPLINTSSFRLESAGGSLYFDFDGSLHNLGGALGVKGFGLPLGLLGGSHDGGNPVASSLLEGAGANNGDPHPVNPSVDVLVYYVNGSFGIHIVNPSPPLWLGVHRQFGPIYIEQIGVEWTNTSAAMLVDGSVQIAALTVQAYELSLNIPFKSLLAPEHWTLDLQGLAVGFQSGPVSISGGLIKNPGPPVEYDGMLSCEIAGMGFTVVGGYARPNDTQGNYTSLFIFVSLPIPLGGPPFLFVTGLGGGAGYNRELQPPTDLNQIPSFFLISAIDDSSLANNPMGALVSMVKFVPARRGSFWLAAGVRFNSFVVVNSVAVVYVALDRGFEIGILGVSHMQLPAPGIELVSIELALKVRFSTAEAVFSIQAQLTYNSWLFSHDCQLTGGFAFCIFFRTGHFVLSIGGYHPAFQKPPEFPDIPRLGFHWQVLGFVQIKGEAYFAITSSAFMCGGRLEASAGFSGIRAWFTIHTDILIQWDPFHYDFDVGVEVGVSLTIEVCFFGACARISITISKGADVHIFGPPFHVDVTFDAYVTTITLSFPGDPHPRPNPLLWDSFRDKYLISGNTENSWVSARVVQGLLPPEPPGATPAPGTKNQPWKLNPEFAFLTESRMPVSGYQAGGRFDAQGAVIQLPMRTRADSKSFDLAAMDKLGVGSFHTATFDPPVTRPEQFVVEEALEWVPEASWRWYDPTQVPAAAYRINAIVGLRITGLAVLEGKSALIPISTLVDDDSRLAQPLPFDTVIAVAPGLKVLGLTAEDLGAVTSVASSNKTIAAAAQLLSGTGIFAEARAQSGLPAPGLRPMAVYALKNSRSAPPLLTPLTTGLSMKPVGLALPPPFLRVGPVDPVILEAPRLRAVMQSRPQPVADAPPSLRTTTKNVSFANALRMAPPRLKVVAGARLERIPAPDAARPTAATFSARALRNPELSALTGTAHSANFQDAARDLAADGVTLPSGTTHLWEIASSSFSLDITGSAAVRVTSMNRAGQVIEDVEMMVNDKAHVVAAAGSEFVAITCLGAAPGPLQQSKPGFAAVTFAAASAGTTPCVGWQVGNVVPQAGGSVLLARGAVLVLRKPYVAVTNNQRTTQGMAEISQAVIAQSGAETWLPKAIGVVMIVLDQQDATAADGGDLGIACDGATLAIPPIAGAGGRRRALLYEVASRDEKAERITISVASKTGWALAGVIGLPGRGAEWAARLHGTVPPHLVPDGPLTPHGEVRVKMSASKGGAS
jgi:hypothetical protein